MPRSAPMLRAGGWGCSSPDRLPRGEQSRRAVGDDLFLAFWRCLEGSKNGRRRGRFPLLDTYDGNSRVQKAATTLVDRGFEGYLTRKKKNPRIVGLRGPRYLGFSMENVTASTSVHSSEIIALEQPRDGLSDYSPNDVPWDIHRGQSDDVGGIYASALEFERYAARMSDCGGLLLFGWVLNPETSVNALRLRTAYFCRVRHCPVCQWRRSLMWQARFHQSLPQIVLEHPKARWLFLTLTVPNCPIGELGATLTAMNAGWNRLQARKELKAVIGWVRTTEVTRSAIGEAHPHFHVLLMVPPSMLSGSKYVKHARWVEIWQECMRDPTISPSGVHVQAIKDRSSETGTEVGGAALQRAVSETLKYSVKPSDMTNDPDWFLELTRQSHKRRFVATGGVLKKVLRVDEETDSDLVKRGGAEEGEDDGSRLAFNWREVVRRYRRAPNGDKPAR